MPCSYYSYLTISPDNPEAYFQLGNLHKALESYTEAIAYYKESVRVLPRQADVWNNLGTTILIAGEDITEGSLHEARECFKKALSIAPRHEKAMQNLEYTKRILQMA